MRDAITEELHEDINSFFQGDWTLVQTIDLRSTGAADKSLEDERESLASNSTPKVLQLKCLLTKHSLTRELLQRVSVMLKLQRNF